MFETLHLIFNTKGNRNKSGEGENVTAQASPAPLLFLHFRTGEKVLFAKRLSFLVKAGVSLTESLTLIRNQTKSRRKRKVFDTIISDVAGGQYLSRSLEKYGKLFGEFTIHIIRVGEHVGTLSQNLAYLADELSKKQSLERKVRSALLYPLFITIATFGVTGTLMVFIFPKITPIFSSLDITLPLLTRVLFAVSEYLSKWGIVTLFFVIIGFIFFLLLCNTYPLLQKVIDACTLRLPIVGGMTRSYNSANFCRTMSLCINAGIGLTESLTITAQVTKNILYKIAYLEMAENTMRGEQMSKGLQLHTNIFPDVLPHMIHVGETTGSLRDTLQYLSEHYEAEVEESTKNLSNSIEPILLMVMGILVGLIAISVITPIYEITKHLQGV